MNVDDKRKEGKVTREGGEEGRFDEFGVPCGLYYK